MKTRLQHILQSELVKNSTKLLSANVVAQAIGLLVYLILSRFYSQEDFGLFNLFLSIGSVFAVISTAEYQYSIVLAKDEAHARASVRLCRMILLATVAVLAISVLFSHPIASLFKAPELARIYWLLPLFVLFTGAWNIQNYRFSRAKKFSRISIYQVTQTSLASILKLVLGFVHYAGGLALSSVLGPLISLVTVGRIKEERVKPAPIREVAREYKNFPLHSLPRSVVNSLSANLPAFLLSPVFGSSKVGLFSMALTLGFRPLNMIASSLYQTFFQRVSEAVKNQEHIQPFFKKYIGYALLIICPSFIVLYFFLPQLTGFLLSEDWMETGELLCIMLPWLASVMVVTPLQFVPDVFGKQRIMMRIEFSLCLLRALSLLCGCYYGSFTLAILLYSCCGLSVHVVEGVWFYSLVSHYDSSLCK